MSCTRNTPAQWRRSRKRGKAFSAAARPPSISVKEFIERAADEIGKGLSDQIGEAAVGGYDASIERDREEQIIEGVDQVAIAALRSLDQLKQLFELPGVGGRGGSLFEPAHQPVQLGHLLALRPSVDPEQADEQNQTGWQDLLCRTIARRSAATRPRPAQRRAPPTRARPAARGGARGRSSCSAARPDELGFGASRSA